MDIEELANEARESISEFCMNECNAYCCRKGFLILNEEELKETVGNKKEILEKENNLIKKEDGTFSLNFSNSLGGCPSLRGSKCLIHKSDKRSKTCHRYPIFINEKNKTIRISRRCLAKKENMFYLFEHKAIELGFKLI